MAGEAESSRPQKADTRDRNAGGRWGHAARPRGGQVRYASPIVRGGQPPVPGSVDIAGAKRIDLVVDFANRTDELDHADWLNARLVR